MFSSFQCLACKAFAPSLENIHKKFGDKVGITFKNFPLSTSCNPRISENMQPQACDAAFAAIAAPTVFINGRQVGAFEESVLTFLIQNE